MSIQKREAIVSFRKNIPTTFKTRFIEVLHIIEVMLINIILSYYYYYCLYMNWYVSVFLFLVFGTKIFSTR